MHTDVRDCTGYRVNTVQDVCSELLFALSQHGLTGQHQGFVLRCPPVDSLLLCKHS